MKQAFRCGHSHEGNHLPAAARLAEDCYVTGIAAESRDVIANPLQDRHNVEHSNVRAAGKFFSCQMSEIEIAVHV